LSLLTWYCKLTHLLKLIFWRVGNYIWLKKRRCSEENVAKTCWPLYLINDELYICTFSTSLIALFFLAGFPSFNLTLTCHGCVRSRLILVNYKFVLKRLFIDKKKIWACLAIFKRSYTLTVTLYIYLYL